MFRIVSGLKRLLCRIGARNYRRTFLFMDASKIFKASPSPKALCCNFSIDVIKLPIPPSDTSLLICKSRFRTLTILLKHNRITSEHCSVVDTRKQTVRYKLQFSIPYFEQNSADSV